MCDTLVAPPASSASGAMLFGKNSDRQRNEAQAVEIHRGRDFAAGETLACTYLTIPQARRTCDVLIGRPFWGWGAELGVNGSGVAIGNEAVHARRPAPEAPALTGMDLVRLALERAATAAEAVDVITGLLAAHGQGGNCGHLTPFFYNNSFLVADAREAFVVETLERDWLVARVGDAPRAISNAFGIVSPDRVSAGLDARIAAEGWGDPAAAGYAAVLADPSREPTSSPGFRRGCSTAALQSGPAIDLAAVMRALRDHGPSPEDGSAWTPRRARPRTVCMHAADAGHASQTTGSLACALESKEGAAHWVTATSAPCLSVFKPVFLDLPPSPLGPAPTGAFDAATVWWRHELWHRRALAGDFAATLAGFAPERDALEADFRARIAAVRGADRAIRAAEVAACWAEAEALVARWLRRLPDAPAAEDDYAAAWAELDRLAGLPERAVA